MTAALLWTCDSWSASKDFTILVFINPEMAWDQPIWHPGSHQRQQCHSCNQQSGWSGAASAPVFWQMSLSESPSATAFILKYCADLQKMLKSSRVWRRCSGMAEQSEFFHVNGRFGFFSSLNPFFSCFIYFLSTCPFLPFWGELRILNVQPLLSELFVCTGPGTKFWTCSDSGVSPLGIWSQIQGICEISKEAVTKLQRVFTFLTGVRWG